MGPDLKKIEKCSACEAPIIWAQTSTGRIVPVDASPVPTGNIMLYPTVDRRFVAIVLTLDELVAAHKQDRELYVSHFATCPRADEYRRPKKARER